MQILRIIPTVDPCNGGPTEGVLQQANAFRALGCETHIATLDPPDAAFVHTFPHVVHALGDGRFMPGWWHYLPWVRYGYSPAFVPWLKAHVGAYDVVVVEGLWTYATMGARRALVGGRVPYVVFTHGMLDAWFRKTYPVKNVIKQMFWWVCEGPLLNHAHTVLFTTEDEKIISRNSFWPYRVKEKVVGFGTGDIAGNVAAQEAAFRAAVPALGARPFLLFLSRLHPKKGCDLLIEAFGRIASTCDLDLVMAGPDQIGWKKQLSERAEALGLTGRIHWPGMLCGDVKWGAFRAAEAFVLPSHHENFGVVVAEAMAVQTPVLITDKINIWREVQDAGGGLVENDDVEGCTRLLQKFLALSEAERVLMGTHARKAFLDHFEITKTASAILSALREAAGA